MRAYADGTVAALIDEALAFPHKQSARDLQRYLDPLPDHDTTARLPQISVPTLVMAGGIDPGARPALGRVVADAIPDARFEVWETESHQPFQEVPERWNARVDAFWQDVGARFAAPPQPRTTAEKQRSATPARPPS